MSLHTHTLTQTKFGVPTGKNNSAVYEELYRILSESNLDFDSNKKNQDSRHYWHAFPAKFPPDLPKLFIERLTEPMDAVLDPMSGSCTTLIEATRMNRKAYGFDIDPLSLIIGKAKLENLDIKDAGNKGLRMLVHAKHDFINRKEKLLCDLRRRFDEETLEFLDYWFLKETQLELLALIQKIEHVSDVKIQNFLKLIFSSIIITKSGGVTLAMDLAHTRPHKVLTKKPNSVFKEFAKKLNKVFNNGYADLPSPAFLREGDAKSLSIGDESIDLIVTSPPYANNAIDYMRAHKFSLVWFGHKISELKNIRRLYIGSESVHKEDGNELPRYTQSIVDRLKKIDKKRGAFLRHYFLEMQESMKEMYRVLKPERACVMVVAPSKLGGFDVETHICLARIGQNIGFDLVRIGKRNIHRDSRMMPASHSRNGSQIESRMHDEYIIGLWKP